MTYNYIKCVNDLYMRLNFIIVMVIIINTMIIIYIMKVLTSINAWCCPLFIFIKVDEFSWFPAKSVPICPLAVFIVHIYTLRWRGPSINFTGIFCCCICAVRWVVFTSTSLIAVFVKIAWWHGKNWGIHVCSY